MCTTFVQLIACSLPLLTVSGTSGPFASFPAAAGAAGLASSFAGSAAGFGAGLGVFITGRQVAWVATVCL